MRTGRQVIIGASAAGVSAAMASRRAGFAGEIVVVGAEPHPPYERPPLSKRLVDVDDVESALSPIVPADQLRSNQVVLRLGLRAQAIDPSAGTVLLDDGEILPADSVLPATGASPRRLEIPGNDLEGICYLRTADDALRLGRRLRWQAPVVVIGAGFIGLEVTAVARGLGRDVTMVEALRLPLLGAVGPELESVFATVHREQGVHLLLDTGVTAFHGAAGALEAIELADGRRSRRPPWSWGSASSRRPGWLRRLAWWWTTASSSTSTGAPACHGCLPPVTLPAARMCTAWGGCASSTGTTRSLRARQSARRWRVGRVSTTASPTSGPTSTTSSCSCSAGLWWISRD
jgi:thioredoxin reductase